MARRITGDFRYFKNPAQEYGNSDLDIRHRFVFSYLWELPIGDEEPGKPAQDNWSTRAFGHIEVAPIFTVESGRPVNPLTGLDSNRSGAVPVSARPAGFGRNSLTSPMLMVMFWIHRSCSRSSTGFPCTPTLATWPPGRTIWVAMSKVAGAKKVPLFVIGAGGASLTNEDCTPYTVHYVYDTTALANGTATAIVNAGGKSWFYLTADYAFGTQLQAWAHRSWWGPGWQSSLVLGNNAPPFYGIGLQRASAARSDSRWLSWMGPWSYEFFIAGDDDTINSYLVGSCTGRLPGFSPRRMRST